MFLGWVVVLIVDECVALSLGEFASKYPTSAGPYYWSFQLASPSVRTVLSFITGMHLTNSFPFRETHERQSAEDPEICSLHNCNDCFADDGRTRLDVADWQLDHHVEC